MGTRLSERGPRRALAATSSVLEHLPAFHGLGEIAVRDDLALHGAVARRLRTWPALKQAEKEPGIDA
jgi:hypothetical protein